MAERKKAAVWYLVLQEIVPGLAAQRETDEELDDVEGEVEYDAVEPDDTSPAPAHALDPGEAPVGIHSNQCSNLHEQRGFRLLCRNR
jgi:hypothetical protein